MSTVLLYTSPARGHLYPMMDVALALREAGHRVVVQTLADEGERLVGEGLEHRPIAPAIEATPLEDYRGGNPIAQFKAAFRCWLARAPHEVEDLRASVADLHPDLLIVDTNTWGALAFAEALGRPFVAFLPYCLAAPDPRVPVSCWRPAKAGLPGGSPPDPDAEFPRKSGRSVPDGSMLPSARDLPSVGNSARASRRHRVGLAASATG